jgi:hypothetical protein
MQVRSDHCDGVSIISPDLTVFDCLRCNPRAQCRVLCCISVWQNYVISSLYVLLPSLLAYAINIKLSCISSPVPIAIHENLDGPFK